VKKIHLIGVCGTAMATLAAMLKRKGFNVRGSDRDMYPPMSTFLEQEGIPTLIGYRAEHVTPDLDFVIVGNAVSRGNPEVEEVLDRKIRYYSLPEALREFFLWGARSIVIAGTHGKTTTTAMTGWALTHAGLDPSVFIGGIAENLGEQGSSYRLGGGRDFVLEGDEYDSAFFDKTAKFLKYLPDIAVVNNIEFDHADIYADLDAIRLAFRRLVNLVPRRGLLLLGADSADAAALQTSAHARVETFGLAAGADWQADQVRFSPEGATFTVLRQGRFFGGFSVPLLGGYNVRNALAAIAVGTEAGAAPSVLADALGRFRGVRRRLEVLETVDGVSIFDDFAHHPTAVRETLAGLRSAYPGRRVWAIFEPRSASSCRRIFQQAFTDAFDQADEVVIAAVYRSSLPENERLSAEQLVTDLEARGKRARYVPRVDDIVQVVASERRPGDLVVIMSNGGFGGMRVKLVAALEAGQ
jgi:UDP-N-acetylmuramate: L-alanyl-gamma-D-glutamyl-meso-diaminopimelate ligase